MLEHDVRPRSKPGAVLLPAVLKTARLTLRPFQAADVDQVLAYSSDPEWARYLPDPQPYERHHAETWVARCILADWDTGPSWAIVHQDRAAGRMGLGIDLHNRRAVIWYALARALWGQGLTTEAARALVDTAFTTHPELARVYASADLLNLASQRVMQKIGMRREAVLRQHQCWRGRFIDDVYYSVLRAEWHPRRHAPEQARESA